MSRVLKFSQHSMRESPTSSQCHGRPCFRWIYVFIFGLLCLHRAGLVEAAFTCPTDCECPFIKDDSNNKWQNISCVDVDLFEVPADQKEGADVLALNLTRNNITMITHASLQYFTHLVDLDLSYNEITFLTEDAFSSLTNLQYLSLEGNDLTYISSAIFQIQNLVSLNLARNPNITFPKEVKPGGSLIRLDISHSSIANIPTNILEPLTELRTLDMSHNSISFLPTDAFSKNTKLEFLNLEGNSLSSMEREWSQSHDLDSIQHLDVSHNAISNVDKDFMKGLDSLVTLDLSNNEIRDIDKDVFKKVKNLESIDLSNNLLNTLDKKLFDDFACLQSLDLSENEIESLDPETFAHVEHLLRLDLGNNELSSITEDLLKHVTGLEYLDLSYNSLTSIPVDVFGSFTGNIVVNITNNPYDCNCSVRNYLYALKYDSKILLYDEDNIKCSDGSKQFVFLDWYSSDCSGNLGWHGCSSVYECYSRNSECNDTNYCVCKPSYYDNNGDNTDGGVCKPKVDLGYPCDLTAACLAANSGCMGTISKVCKCKAGYYDDNKDTSLGGTCRLKVELGAACTMDSMCATNNSHCDLGAGQCDCISTHYDNNGGVSGGSCQKKLALYENCTATYQCAPANSECSTGGICDCVSNFYDMDGVGTCQGASSFFSCYLDETDGDNKPVEFSDLKTGKTQTTCEEYCFSQNKWHITLKDSYCLCGSTAGSTITGCCPYSQGSASCTTTKAYLPAADIVYITSGLHLLAVPLLITGRAHRFEATTTLSVIDQIKWNFGDSESEETVDASSSFFYHTYTHSDKYTVTVSACMKSAGVCHTATIPVIVQVPDVNLTTWITGYQRADVSKSVTDMTATFIQGYDFEFIWSRTDSNSKVIYSKGCETGWLAHRQTCLKTYPTKGAFSTAGLKCSNDESKVLELNYMEEIPEIVSLLSISSSDKIYINAQKQSNGAYKWLSSNSKTFFSKDHLADSSLGDYVVLDPSTSGLTSSDGNTKHKTVCMKDPVSCPYGGSLNTTNGKCYKLISTTVSWEDAKSDCVSTYNGCLANLKDQSTHAFVADSMVKNSISEAWFGLSDRSLEGYYTWSDDTSYNYNQAPYKPTITSLNQDCFVVINANTWKTEDCHSLRSYVCEYSIQNERLTVPSFLAGSPDIQITGNNNLEQIVEMTTFTSSGTKEVMLFPGMWFSRHGSIRSWVIHTVDVGAGENYKLAIQVYRPECTSPTALVQPGCEDSMFASCSASSPTCSSSSSCDDTKFFCYLSSSCKSFSESCTCNSESSSASAVQACHNYYTGSQPTYKLVGQTMVTVDQVGEHYITIPANSISVQENDVIGIEFEKGNNVIKCEDLPMSKLQQTSYIADVSNWLIKDSYFPAGGATTSNQTCYFQAIYTQDSAQNLTQYLGYFNSTGSYSLKVEIPYNSVTKTLSVNLDEAVSDIKWVYPVIAEPPSVSTSLGAVYIECGMSYDFTLSVGRGTSLTATFSFNSTSPQAFHSSCPSDISTKVSDACNTNLIWSSKPFAYFRHSINSTGTQNLSVTINNLIDSKTKTITLRIEKRVTSVAIACTTSPNNIIAVNDAASFSTSVVDGTGLSYLYMIDGTPVAGTSNTMIHTFASAGNFNVSVSVSNILGASQASLTMTVILPANFANCHFTSASYIAAVGVNLTMSVSCEVVLHAVVQAYWYISDRPSATPLSSTETASSSTTVTWTQSIVFSSASSSVMINVTYTDLINSGSLSNSVTVYEAVPSVILSPSVAKTLVNDLVTFTATVPSGNYGPLTYTFEFGNGATDNNNSGIVTYFYTNPGNYSVKAIASNGPSQAEKTMSFEVVETVSGLKISSDSPTKLQQVTTFNVSVGHGTGVRYNFFSTVFNLTVNQNTFMYVFPSEGNYTVDVTATNDLTEETGSILVYIMDEATIYADDLRMDGGSFSSCIESGTEHEYTASVIHFDTAGLQFEFDFGDSTQIQGSQVEKHTYTAGNDYHLVLTVRYPASSAEIVLSSSVCVQDRIINPIISVDLKIGLPQSGSATRSANATLSSGTSPTYSWATNASYLGSVSGSSFNLQFTTTGFYYIAVNISNEINFESAPTVVVEVMNAISGLAITCVSCTDKAGHKYIEKGVTFNVSASIVSGDQVTYTWTFNDGNAPSTGASVTRSYSATGIYNVTVKAQNDVGSEIEYFTVYVEEALTTVDLTTYGSSWLSKTTDKISVKNMLTEFEATVSPSGMKVEYSWVFESGLAPYTTGDGIAGYNYTNTGQKQCMVTVQNSINAVTDTLNFYIIEAITSISLKLNGTGVSGTSTSVALNRKYLLEISANTDIKCSYLIVLRKSGKYVDNAANYTMEYTFINADTYTLEATVTNDLGDKKETFQIAVIEEITSPSITVSSGGASITLGNSISFSGSAQGTSPVYTWSYKHAPGNESVPATNTGQSITLTPGTVGTYIVELSITNDVTSPQTTEFTFEVMEAVSGVSIQSSLVPPDAVLVGTVVTFTATTTAGSDLSYVWDIDSNVGTQSTFSFHFTMQSLYTVSVNVSNPASSEVASVQIYALYEVPPFNLSITIATLEASVNKYVAVTGSALEFTSDLTDITFLTFGWTLGNTTAASATKFSKTFTTAGTYDVMLNASNKISSSTSQITVLIQDPITGLQVSNCMATYLVNTAVTLKAVYIKGSDVSVSWNLDSLGVATGDSTAINYTTPGTYTINATASNFVDVQTKSCVVIIQGAIDNLALFRSNYLFAGYPVTFTVTGDNLASASFKWTVSGIAFTNSVSTWTRTFTTKGNYTLTVIVSNAVSSKDVSMTLTIEELACSVPQLSADGSATRTTLRARAVELGITVLSSGCTAYSSSNKWALYNATSCSAALTNEFILGSTIATNTPTLLIPETTLPYGSYCAVFENSYENTPVTQTEEFNLTIMDSELKAVIVGGDKVVIGEGTELHLDASGSHDPDKTPGTTLTYTWTCIANTGSNSVCTAINAVTSASVNLTSLTLTSGDIYMITVTVSAPGRKSGFATQELSVKAAGSPIVKVSCISCIANGHYSVCSSKSVAFRGTCLSGCDDTTTFAWSVTTAAGSPVTIDNSKTSTGFSKENFVIKSGILQDGTDYSFKLTATTETKVGSSSITLVASTVPSSGSCTVSPTVIIPLSQKVTISCKNWQDTDTMTGLHYKIIVENFDKASDEYILYYGTNAESNVHISPWPGSSKVFVKVYVLNDYGSGTHAISEEVTFGSPALSPNETMTDFIVSHLQSNMMSVAQQNNPMMLMEYVIAILNLLNEESRTAVDTSELSKRTAVRDLLTTVIKGLPRPTTYDIQQMASATQFLSEYKEELLVPSTLEAVCNLVKSLTTELSAHVKQGLDQSDLQPVSLLTANKNLYETYLLGLSGVPSDALALFGNLNSYIPAININTGSSSTYSSYEEQRQKMIEEMLEYSNKAITIPLLAMLANEDEFSTTIGTMKIHAQRVTKDAIWRKKDFSGVSVIVPANIFAQASYYYDEVFQIVTVASNNPLNFSSSVNTYTADISFSDPDGTKISVASLSDPIKMYLFADWVVPYEVENDSLVSSQNYNPLEGMLFEEPTTLGADITFEAAIPKLHKDGAGIHIQIRVDFFDPGGRLQATLYKDDVGYTENDAVGVRPLTVTEDMMAVKNDHRDFTFFDVSGTTESAYKVQVSSNVKANITMGVYYSDCVFYDTSTSLWSNSGCEPLDESIASVAVCACNHMTFYGGSVLLSPDQIDFTDLTRLDIPSNPVAIITCSVILMVYIIAVVICKKMDIMDVRRISTIPLCGKDGSFKYEVTIITGRQVGAGTTANVGCRIVGEYGKTARQHLNKKGAFQRNCSDSFLMAYDVNLGEIKKVSVWHDNRGTSPSWYLDHVIVKDLQTDKKYYFFCASWLTLEDEKGSIQKELKAAGSAEMQKFGRQIKTATFNSLADKHLWFSILNRPAQSRFTRVQRATCCVTLLYTFIAVNAMWYGLVKKNNSASIIGDFGWEEVIVGLVSNIMVFPINIGIIFLFKKSRSKPSMFDPGRKPQTAQTIEIENLCDHSQGGSFQSSGYGVVPSDLERESTVDSLPRNTAALGLHRSRHVKSMREDTDDNLIKKPIIATTAASAKGPMWNQDSIMKWPEKMPYSEDADSSRPSTSSTTLTNVRPLTGKPGRKTSVPGTADSDELLKYLDEMESDLKESEERSMKNPGSRKPSTSIARKHSTQTSRWGSLEDILHSDDESAVTDSSKKKLKKNNSTTSQTSQDKKFNPREEPRINGHGRWLKSRESYASGSMIGGEHFYYNRGHISSESGIAAGLKPGYQSHMTLQSQDIPVLPSSSEKCTLPSWCIYIAYVLCFLLCTFSVILVILYCFKFGYEESVEWVLAFIFALFQSIILVEPVKAVLFAVYMVLVLKKVEQDEDEDCIDIEPTFDNSSELIKDVKFKPMSGFALMQAKEEGHKMHRMKVMLRQFIAYIFYLWLLMVIVYVNFPYSSYLFNKHVENSFISTDHSNGSISFNNISSIDDFWDWAENVFADTVHVQDSNTDEEHGFLLGVARMRLIRSTTRTCEASGSAAKLGASSLMDRTCYGTTSYEEDTASYGEGWNDSSYNLSWKHSTGADLGGSHKVGHVATYGGGGYVHNLGTTLSQTQAVIHDLRSKDWVDLQTRAVILELAEYSPGTDMTALIALLVEFPLTGSAVTSYEIQTQRLLWFRENQVDPLMICEIILLLVTIYTLVHIVISIRDMGKQFFKDSWNWYEMLTTLMTMVAIGMYLGCVVEATNTFNHLLADQTGFTNFERVMYVHVGMRYLNAWLLFLLMFKVVKQLRFVKFMHIYEKTISTAVGQLLGSGLIFSILLLIYAQVGYLMYGHVYGFESVGHSIVTLIVMIRGTFDFWPMLDYQPVFSHFYIYSYYAFTYGLTVALVIAILNNTYKTNRSQMYFKSTLDLQDYEMVDFMMKRFKLWAGIQKEKPAFRRVKFQGLPSISSRSSSSYSRQSSSSSSHQSSSLIGPEYSRVQLDNMMSRLEPTWMACVNRFERIQDLDKEEESLVKKTESEVKELNFRLRVNGLEKERRELLNWTKADKPPLDQNQRQSILKKSTSKDITTDKKPPASVIGASRTSGTPPTKTEGSLMKGKRPLSDQGARNDLPANDKGMASEPKTLQKFLQQLKPSKSAWNK